MILLYFGVVGNVGWKELHLLHMSTLIGISREAELTYHYTC